MAVLNQEYITSHLYSEKGEDEPLTSLVMDQESFDHIWDLIEELDLKKMQGGDPHPELMAYARKMGRLPIIVKTERTKPIFDELGELGLVLTSKFTGIVRGASKNKLVLKKEWKQA
jgi:hypothetical protein